MAVEISTDVNDATKRLIQDDDVNATAEDDILTGACSLESIDIDNGLNAAEAEYFKFYDHAAPTVGTTAPDMIVKVAGGQRVRIDLSANPLALATGLSIACVQEAGTAGTTPPTAAVVVTLKAAV